MRVLDSGTISTELDFLYYPLYPHKFDDLIFIIYQRGNLKDEAPRSSTKPLTQWLIFTFIAALMLLLLREVVERRNRRLRRRASNVVTPDYLLGSFVDSMGVFLGVALNRIGNCRAEHWFLISFSVFGLLFRTIYTDNLFVMFTAVNQNRITSIDQLFQANIRISVDYVASKGDDDFYVRNRM